MNDPTRRITLLDIKVSSVESWNLPSYSSPIWLMRLLCMELVFGELHFSPHLWIGPLPFFKGSLTWENNAIFSSHCFTLCERRHSAFNSETLKRTTSYSFHLKTDNLHRAVELPPCLVLELVSRPSLSDARSHAAFELWTNRNVYKISFLGSNL